jgi:hypothetical protein
MQNELLPLATARHMTASELRTFGALAPRQLSLFCTRYAMAKDAAEAGNAGEAEKYLAAAKASYKRSCEDEHGQTMRVREVAAVVAANGDALDATAPGGKRVVKLGIGHKAVTWLDSWAR